MNGDALVMPIWLIAAIAVLIAAALALRMVSGRARMLWVNRFRSAPLAAAGALAWANIGPGPSTLRALTAACWFALTALSEWWFVSGGGPIAIYRRALRRNLTALPQTERRLGVVAWLVLALTIASIGLLAASAAYHPLSRR